MDQSHRDDQRNAGDEQNEHADKRDGSKRHTTTHNELQPTLNRPSSTGPSKNRLRLSYNTHRQQHREIRTRLVRFSTENRTAIAQDQRQRHTGLARLLRGKTWSAIVPAFFYSPLDDRSLDNIDQQETLTALVCPPLC